MMKLFLVLFLAAATSAFEGCGLRSGFSRIIGGRDASLGEFPWQVSIRVLHTTQWKNYTSHNCGGVIANKRWILTAAHCINKETNLKNLLIRVGDLRLYQDDGTEQDFAPSKIVTHSKWNTTGKLENDIALIQVSEDVNLTGPHVGSACLPRADFHGANDCWFSGWGLTEPNIWDPPNQLQKVKGKIWTKQALDKVWGAKIQPGMLGFGHDGRWPDYGPCSGDSGGPLVCQDAHRRWAVVGIASFATSTCRRLPGVFTETAFYHDWIQRHIKEEARIN